jgi:hypothetical protein
MLGTAFPAARLLLVEEPFPWGPEGLRTSHFSSEIALELEAKCRADDVRVQAIRRPGAKRGGSPRAWAVVDTRDEQRIVYWGHFDEDADLLDLPLDGSAGTPDPEPMYLVCTHGKHDPCCGQYGRLITASLENLRPGRVWQASHLGGCRFAPTVLVLPVGVMYGRVPSVSVPDLVAATERGEVVLPLLRGRIGTPPAAQAAIGFAQEHLQLTNAHDVTLISVRQIDWYTAIVRASTPTGTIEIVVKRERVDATGLTCGAPGPICFVAHHLDSVRPVPGA